MTDPVDLGDFLRRRRELLRPADVGLVPGARRRTPGLHREEVALLAGVSPDYYARLEQGRGSAPSEQVVDALARALRCDHDQHDHLLHLAGHPTPPRQAGRHVSPGLSALADRLVDVPVVIITELGEVLWANRLGESLLGELPAAPGRERSIVWRWFTDPSTRVMPAEDWDRVSAAHVSDLRAVSARRSADPDVRELVDGLLAASEEFASLWRLHQVAVRHEDVKTFLHPEVGAIPLRCQVLLTPEEGVQMMAYLPLEGTDAAERLELLRVIGNQVFERS